MLPLPTRPPVWTTTCATQPIGASYVMDARVAVWFATLDARDLYLSSLVIGEIRAGLERVRPRDSTFAATLEIWLDRLQTQFSARIWPVDVAVAERWGRLQAGRTLPVVDGLLVATALHHGATLVTRNHPDIATTGVAWYDPFSGLGAAPVAAAAASSADPG